MQFVLSIDDKYVMPAGIMIISVCENNPGHHTFYVLTGTKISSEGLAKLEAIVYKYNSCIEHIVIPSEFESILPIGRYDQPEYITIATYYRLFLPQLLPADVEKVIYLDGDIICRAPLDEMWKTDLSESPMGAVYEIENNDGRYERLQYDSKYGYFNAGVLLINMSYWRKYNVSSLFSNYIEKNTDRIVYHDQDVLNSVFHSKVTPLPLRFNALNSYFVKADFGFRYPMPEVEETRKNPAIVHFSSHLKPWYKGCSHPYTYEFLKYKALSPWGNDKLITFPASSFKDVLINIIVSIGLHHYNGNYITIKDAK